MVDNLKQESSGDPDGFERLAKRCSVAVADRISYLPDAKVSLIRDIDRGIVHVAAFWSGPAIQAFCEIAKTIEDVDKSNALSFTVADIDGSHGLAEIPELAAIIGGWGETIWIRTGKIVFQTGKVWSKEQFVGYTDRLIDME